MVRMYTNEYYEVCWKCGRLGNTVKTLQDARDYVLDRRTQRNLMGLLQEDLHIYHVQQSKIFEDGWVISETVIKTMVNKEDDAPCMK